LDTGKVSWADLRDQKEVLELFVSRGDGEKYERDAMEGIIGLIDYVQDQAAKVLGEKEVFGDLTGG